MKTLALLGCLFIGCASTRAASGEERVMHIVRAEALRLLAERLHVQGHVGQVSETTADRTTRHFIVTFSDVSDTAAEVSVDARSNVIASSSIGGGL